MTEFGFIDSIKTLFAPLPDNGFEGIGSVGESTLSKQQESLETALEHSISQCYAVEGCYPPSLEYLEQHYGLLYDEDSFFIDYEYYGSNLLPEVTVLRRTGAH